MNEDLKFVYAKYNTNIAVDLRGRLFMWGENSNNMRLRKPKLFYSFQERKIEIIEVALGRRHGVIRTNESIGGVYVWGDGTYGELGLIENLPIEKPIKMPFFEKRKIMKIDAGARHTLVLDKEGNIFAMGDNSED
jgi:alpha-tubulin suppressor-like RCC1 family protein